MRRTSLIRLACGRFGLGSFAAALLAICSAGPARAAFVAPSGWTRGDAGSTYQHWDVFSAANHPLNHPADVALINPNGVPLLADNGGGSIVTGGGNIYSPGAAEDIDITVPNYGLGVAAQTTVILQTRTMGIEIDASTVNIGGVAPSVAQELSRVSLGGQGFDVETLWQWDLPGNAAQYVVEFTAQDLHMSLASAAVDTYVTVPEPAAMTMIVSAGLALLCVARRLWRGNVM